MRRRHADPEFAGLMTRKFEAMSDEVDPPAIFDRAVEFVSEMLILLALDANLFG